MAVYYFILARETEQMYLFVNKNRTQPDKLYFQPNTQIQKEYWRFLTKGEVLRVDVWLSHSFDTTVTLNAWKGVSAVGFLDAILSITYDSSSLLRMILDLAMCTSLPAKHSNSK